MAVVFNYDDAGNPTYYKDNDLVWEKGRQLKKYGKYHFEYNANGIRTARYFDTNVDGETVQVRYDYELEGSKVVRMLYRLFQYGVRIATISLDGTILGK
ncbi:MAG: hypothetical protein IKV53_07550 [Clostridia bacterium]|nr:hypothetical protein [Clostridia bacterium]